MLLLMVLYGCITIKINKNSEEDDRQTMVSGITLVVDLTTLCLCGLRGPYLSIPAPPPASFCERFAHSSHAYLHLSFGQLRAVLKKRAEG